MRKPHNYSFLSEEEQFNKAFSRSIKYLSYRIRSTKEVIEFLSQKGFTENIIYKVIQKLSSLKFLNDEEFAKSFAGMRQRTQAKSKGIIKQELKQKGISDELISEILTNAQDDLKTAKEYFEKRKKRFERYEGQEYFQKAAAFLQRRGFSWEIVKKVIKESEF